ncbi:MAG: hypothetical protein ACPLRZ_11585 [Thermovenabulum sp.]|uniref:hypothetical protein n=1 Tax=Thermovenabulum sp. TaxID=3100335 RepID=UPI003C7A418A
MILNEVERKGKATLILVFILVILTDVYFLMSSYNEIIANDTLWHIKSGEWMIKNKAIIKKDVFSWTARGIKWTAHSWLYDIIIYVLYKYSSFAGPIIFTLILGAIYGYLLIVNHSNNFYMLITSYINYIIVLKYLWTIRPHTVAGVLFIFLLYILTEGKLKDGSCIKGILIFVYFVLWANMHSSVSIGIFVITIYVIFCKADWKHLIFSIIGTVITPQFTGIFRYSYAASSNADIINNINEWHSPDFHNILFIYIAVTSIINLIIKAKEDSKITEAEIIMTANLLLFLKSLRHMLMLVPVISMYSVDITRTFAIINKDNLIMIKRYSPLITMVIMITMLLTMILGCNANQVITNIITGDILSQQTEAKVAQYILENKLTENIFNDYLLGDYFLWYGIPVFIDSRADMYIFNKKEIWDDFMALRNITTAEPEKIIEKHNIKTVAIDKKTRLSLYMQKLAVEGKAKYIAKIGNYDIFKIEVNK